MKCAVLYQSKSGNTKLLAEKIYSVLESEEKELINIDESPTVPDADLYFVGFGVHGSFCSMDILDLFEKIDHGAIALFATCGCLPIDTYKYTIERKILAWLSNEVNYLGMFLCQGKVDDYRKKIIMDENKAYKNELIQMFERGDHHPNSDDLEDVSAFVKTTLDKMSQ